MNKLSPLWLCCLWSLAACTSVHGEAWVVDSDAQWEAVVAKQQGLTLEEGVAVPEQGGAGTLVTGVKRFDKPRRLASMTIEQSPLWQDWEPIDNLGPANMGDAPVFLVVGPGNYWAFGRYRGSKSKDFKPEPATLEGFDVELTTTPWDNQYDAPGGRQKGLGGYHAWQSRDMVSWVHHGPVTEGFSKWVTSAEHIDGKTYIYYDFPNDQDPHVYIDADLTDGKPGKNMGLAVNDPSDGSDAAFIRDRDGRFHVILEDWSPIKASKRSWDSPLAAHAVSDNGVDGWTFLDPAVDHRTKPTGKMDTYSHPHWKKEDPKRFPTNVATYEIHEPEQPAYGDWAAIGIGSRYYLFADYDPSHGAKMSVAWFTSDDINKPFTFCDHIGNGHPDPDIGFAEGRFYLWTQQTTDYTSTGPWVGKVEARVGIDTTGDGKIDRWMDWAEVKETYDYVEGFSKQVDVTPAKIDLSALPASHGVAFELRLSDATKNKSRPMIDRVTVEYGE